MSLLECTRDVVGTCPPTNRGKDVYFFDFECLLLIERVSYVKFVSFSTLILGPEDSGHRERKD